MNILNELSESMQRGDVDATTELTQKAINDNLSTRDILDSGLIAGMNIVGQKFKSHEIFLPDVLLAAKAMNAAMEILRPLLIGDSAPSVAKVVIGTVQGDLHDIGKNLVGIMLRGAGFEVIDLGKDVAPGQFIDEAEKSEARVIGMSALLTTTMPKMAEVVKLAKERGVYGKVKIIVGGAPLSNEYAKQIGADAYCFDGVSAVECVKNLVGVN